jgi:peroxiredoxin
MLTQGDPAPPFEGRSSIGIPLSLQNLGGRYVVLTFLGSSTFGPVPRLVQEVERNREVLDACDAYFIGVSIDPADEKQGRLKGQSPRVMFLWDGGAAVSRLYGAAFPDGRFLVHSLVLDPGLRVLAAVPFEGDGPAHVRRVAEVLRSVPPAGALDGFAPVLILPHVFEAPLCKALIERYAVEGGQEVGSMVDYNGQTVRTVDHSVKRRGDWVIYDPEVIAVLDERVRRRVFPELRKAFQFTATQVDHYVVGCYDADAGGGYFRPHRDNTTRATAHRRFAVSVALDNEAYDGGTLHFPEYGSRGYRAPTGGAVVFSCSLVHEVRAVTRGKRYACLPFIFDDEAAKVRDANRVTQAAQAAQAAQPATGG